MTFEDLGAAEDNGLRETFEELVVNVLDKRCHRLPAKNLENIRHLELESSGPEHATLSTI